MNSRGRLPKLFVVLTLTLFLAASLVWREKTDQLRTLPDGAIVGQLAGQQESQRPLSEAEDGSTTESRKRNARLGAGTVSRDRIGGQRHAREQNTAVMAQLGLSPIATMEIAPLSELISTTVSPVQTLSASRVEEPERAGVDNREARGDRPDEAARFRRMQMQDENGNIPIDGLQKARRQMDRMRVA